MAPRKTVLRIILVAGLAVLLSGCYAHGGGRYSAAYGGGDAYGASYAYGRSSHYAPPGHAYHRSGRRAHRRHGTRYRGW